MHGPHAAYETSKKMESSSKSNMRQGCVANRSKSYDSSFKLAAVQMAERTPKLEAARRYNVDTKRVREYLLSLLSTEPQTLFLGIAKFVPVSFFAQYLSLQLAAHQ